MTDAQAEKDAVVHWFGEPGQGPTTLHGNGHAHLGLGSGDEDEVTCGLCLTLLARRVTPPGTSTGGGGDA